MRKKRLTERFALKVLAYFVTVLSFCIAVAVVIGCIWLGELGFYEKNLEALKIETMSEHVIEKSSKILNGLYENDSETAYKLCMDTNLQFQVMNKKGIPLVGNYDGTETKYVFEISRASDVSYDNMLKVVASAVLEVDDSLRTRRFFHNTGTDYLGDDKVLYMYISEDLPYQDSLSMAIETVSLIFSIRFYLPAVAVACVILCLGSFIFQMCSAGRKYGEEGVSATGFFRIPLDILTCAMILVFYLLLSISFEILWGSVSVGEIVVLACICVAASVIGIGFALIWAIQAKAKIWWRNTVICRLLLAVLGIIRLVVRAIKVIYRNLPDLLQVGIGILCVLVLELGLFFLWGADASDILVVWFVEKLLIIPVILYITLVLSRLLRASEALAEGNLAYQVDTKMMIGDFKEHGENLNSIAEGLNVAVDERMKSERLKTELITNVSHDIKTPLTSIINYADLIGEEPTENEKITEYAKVLQRHSARLKKLIEDLMEASKASTGNVEVHMAPCEVGVLLTQTAGEYEQRLEEQGLELITRHPETPVRIMADGKLMWRIFDNLMNNACKYAMKGTRVYLTVEEVEEKVRISFKNISRYQLEVSAEDLMERFVRGDHSRNTEGNGLGLSITQSLTQLQGGTLQLTVDGDFFKVVLTFDGIR